MQEQEKKLMEENEKKVEEEYKLNLDLEAEEMQQEIAQLEKEISSC